MRDQLREMDPIALVNQGNKKLDDSLVLGSRDGRVLEASNDALLNEPGYARFRLAKLEKNWPVITGDRPVQNDPIPQASKHGRGRTRILIQRVGWIDKDETFRTRVNIDVGKRVTRIGPVDFQIGQI